MFIKSFIFIRLPFDFRNSYVYPIAFTAQTASFIFVMFGCVYNMSFLAGLSCCIQAFARDIKQELNTLSKINIAQEDYKTSQGLIGDFVEIHGKMKKLIL